MSFYPWELVKDISQIPEEKALSGRNCTSLNKGIFPFNPPGQISQCFYTFWDVESHSDFYVALMADGSLKYWENNKEDTSLFIFLGLILSIALSFTIAVIISFDYLTKYLVQRIRRKYPGSSVEIMEL